MKLEVRPYVLSIDPGSRGIGYAIWWMDEWRRLTAPVEVGDFIPPRECEWYEGITDTLEHLYSKCTGYGIGMSACMRVYCEMPEFRNTAHGHGVAAGGDFAKLCCATGAVIWFADRIMATFIPVPVSQWKGQLPKDVVRKRVIDKLTDHCDLDLPAKANAWDAIGIGLYCKGHF